MKDKYEISLWEDFPDTTSGGVPFLNERKLCVIGSDTMTSQTRALEPKMVTNINGTNTFTFKMYYSYIDNITGETVINPFGNLLINERKVKVLWKDTWYDMIIKSLDEDTATKCITYTCKDLFITELSKNGYNLEFSVDLQNSTGTASELATAVLDGSGWQFDTTGSTKIIQKTEEPVYEVNTAGSITAIKQSPNGDTSVTIPSGKKVLVFYSQVADITNTSTQSHEVQFLYSAEGYATEENDMLVLNGDCYVGTFNAYRSGSYVYCQQSGSTKLSINTNGSVSTQYRAERLVKSQITEYDELFDRYVNVYTDNQTSKKVYGYTKTEFSDPLTVVNLLANPTGFTNVDGWLTSGDISWETYPPFTSTTSITTYSAKSYLKLPSGYTYNSAISSNAQYLKPSSGDIKNGNTGGFHVGERYVFRIKMKSSLDGSYLFDNSISPLIMQYNLSGGIPIPTGSNYFSIVGATNNGNWREYVLTCVNACPAESLDSIGFFVQLTSSRYIEDIQFFKYATGITTYDSTTEVRINPGEMSLQSISKTIYRYYNADHNGVTDVEQLTFLYEGEIEQGGRFIPRTNNYEKIATIEVKGSNRFNILQEIAEQFECWVRFNINHDSTGRVTFGSDGLPQKYVTLVEHIGTDLGWSFEYSIDVKGIRRTIVSDQLTTKVIVLPNENQFGQYGFCSIARSKLNPTRENFILDFDYYISQGLLDKVRINSDLYSTSNEFVGYYYYLASYNKEYDNITEILTQKQLELTKQESQLTVLQAQQKATQEKIEKSKSDIMTLACVDTWADAQSYAQTHADHTKVQSLMNTIARLTNTVNNNATTISNLTTSITRLTNYINGRIARQEELITLIKNKHTAFFKKYARYISEGTWQDASYIDDNKYYLDALDVAYTSSRPQLQYNINVMRLTALEDFSSKKFNVGDICYVIDREYFGYTEDGITPYKLKIVISEITSFFDEPQKDIIKVQNYKTQFDDLFQRITATTQSLQYSQGSYEKAAGAIKSDRTIDFSFLQDTFDQNKDIVLSASNQQVTWDSTGITITDDKDASKKVKMMAGGVFASSDGGATWKNAIRGDGISTDLLTAGRINTGEIYIYDGRYPTFRWDGYGIDAYQHNNSSIPNFGQFVRFDQYGIYGYKDINENPLDFVPEDEDDIWESELVKFGLTWKGFFLRGETPTTKLTISDDGEGIVFDLSGGSGGEQGEDPTHTLQIKATPEEVSFSMTGKSGASELEITSNDDETKFLMKSNAGNNSLEISTTNDILIKTGNINRIQIGRFLTGGQISDYGIWIRDSEGYNIFNVSANGTDAIGGWNLTKDSFYHQGTVGNVTQEIGLYSQGKSATVQGIQNTFHILAGSNFGVTVDGKIYASAGKIGGWTINSDTLTGGNITIDSAGNIKCIVNSNKMWDMDNAGKGYFHNIEADGGYIAGWHIESDKIWNDSGTSLNVGNSYTVNKYTIVTDSIKATAGNVGGWNMDTSGFTGNGIGLYNGGSITVGGLTITANQIQFANGNTITSGGSSNILMNYNCTVSNWLAAGGEISSAEGFKVLSSTVMQDYHFNYLNWLYNNWGQVTPEQVRRAGIASVYVESVHDFTQGSYNRDTGRLGMTIHIDLEGELADGTEVAGKQNIAKTIYVPATNAYDAGWDDCYDDYGGYGYVELDYYYNMDRRKYEVWASCSRCGSSAHEFF